MIQLPALLSGISTLFLVTGTLFAVAMTLGIMRFPDAYTRLHAGTKGLTIGAGLLMLGSAMRAPDYVTALRMIIVAVFLMVTNPISTQAIARASYRIERARRHLVVDEYGEAVDTLQDTGSQDDDGT
ncbi:MAG: monovalent cation/H(+) antiporter subunit G [Spirochaetaceae bacterium]|nr:MAG: monovalent cation/H(+) antiporter subunit G [Spirochaetaceae bacterium]